MQYRQYEVWHDESKVNGYHHGILFVPVDKRNELIRCLKMIRDEHNYPYKSDLKFAGCFKKPKIGRLIANNLSLFSCVIKTKVSEVAKIYNPTKEDKHNGIYNPFLEISELFGCRFGFLKVEDNFKSLYFDSYAKKVETTFRFVLKCCCHGMFSPNNPIEIIKFYFDGDEHHECNIDLKRIISGDFREYCKIPDDIGIDSRRITERRGDTKLIMNFVDNIVGAWRAKVNNEKDKNQVLFPLSEIYHRLLDNKIFTNPNSEWYKSISLSEFCIANGGIEFLDIFRDRNQMAFL